MRVEFDAGIELDSLHPAPATPLRKFDGRILRAAASITVAGIVVKVAATVKEIVVADVYGRSDAMDAFLAALFIPNLLVNLIAESMNQALMPTFVRVRLQHGREKARELLAHSMLRVILLLGVVSVVLGLSARFFFPLIAWGF